MSVHEQVGVDLSRLDGEDIPDRARRALDEYQTVFAVGGGVFTVVGEGSSYRVDLRDGRCTCPDHKHREATCKHQWRVLFAVSGRAIPEGEELTGDTLVHKGGGSINV